MFFLLFNRNCFLKKQSIKNASLMCEIPVKKRLQKTDKKYHTRDASRTVVVDRAVVKAEVRGVLPDVVPPRLGAIPSLVTR